MKPDARRRVVELRLLAFRGMDRDSLRAPRLNRYARSCGGTTPFFGMAPLLADACLTKHINPHLVCLTNGIPFEVVFYMVCEP
jgi:hypothetical protein